MITSPPVFPGFAWEQTVMEALACWPPAEPARVASRMLTPLYLRAISRTRAASSIAAFALFASPHAWIS